MGRRSYLRSTAVCYVVEAQKEEHEIPAERAQTPRNMQKPEVG